MKNKKSGEITYRVKWSGHTTVWCVVLSPKSSVKKVLTVIWDIMGCSYNQMKKFTIHGSKRPYKKYTLNQEAPSDDTLLIFREK